MPRHRIRPGAAKFDLVRIGNPAQSETRHRVPDPRRSSQSPGRKAPKRQKATAQAQITAPMVSTP
jgi:hypothetical protein